MTRRLGEYVFIIAVVLLALAGIIAFTHYGNPSSTSGSSVAAKVHFTVVMSATGFNGSVNVAPPWPVLRVSRGQVVTIHIENADPVEAHGLAITHYYEDGVTVRPGETRDLTFVVDSAGKFQVFCNIFCAVHPQMQNGQLIVAA